MKPDLRYLSISVFFAASAMMIVLLASMQMSLTYNPLSCLTAYCLSVREASMNTAVWGFGFWLASYGALMWVTKGRDAF